MHNTSFLSIKDIKHALASKKISREELLINTLQNFVEKDATLESALEIFDVPSIKEFSAHDVTRSLYGVPCLIKDNICQKNRITSCSSKILANYKAPYNATAVHRLQEAGSFCIGRATCDEFAMGSSGEYSAFKKAKNPWDHSRVPGGSSSGSIAAVAAGLVPFALGSETGGSVRQPATFCGIVGLKPTYGLISRYGLIAYASSIDQIGIATRSVEDCAEVLSVIAGKDAHDSTTRTSFDYHDYTQSLKHACLKGKKIAYIENALHAKGMTEAVKEKLLEALKTLENLGAEIIPLTLETMEYSAAVYIILSRAEAASNLSRFDGVKYGYRSPDVENLEDMYVKSRSEGFGKSVQRRILIGNYVLSAGYADQYYNKARSVQKMMRKEFLDACESYDALFCPVSPDIAFKFGEISTNALAIDLQDYFTAAANLTGIPALALPCGFINNMPIGFQLMAGEFKEQELLSMGHAYQQGTNFHLARPPLYNT